MYKKRSLATAENADALSSTPETTSSTASNNIVPQDNDIVNSSVRADTENDAESQQKDNTSSAYDAAYFDLFKNSKKVTVGKDFIINDSVVLVKNDNNIKAKPVYVISPFYSFDDYKNQAQAKKWRIVIEQAIKELNYKNIRYINGLDLIGDMSLISADEVHPDIYGIAQVAERLTGLIKRNL